MTKWWSRSGWKTCRQGKKTWKQKVIRVESLLFPVALQPHYLVTYLSYVVPWRLSVWGSSFLKDPDSKDSNKSFYV
jgi:hypothetical protein